MHNPQLPKMLFPEFLSAFHVQLYISSIAGHIVNRLVSMSLSEWRPCLCHHWIKHKTSTKWMSPKDMVWDKGMEGEKVKGRVLKFASDLLRLGDPAMLFDYYSMYRLHCIFRLLWGDRKKLCCSFGITRRQPVAMRRDCGREELCEWLSLLQ